MSGTNQSNKQRSKTSLCVVSKWPGGLWCFDFLHTNPSSAREGEESGGKREREREAERQRG